MERKIKLVLAIRSLDTGGAERQFIELVKKINYEDFDLKIISNYKGHLDNEIANYRHIIFEKKGRWDVLYFFRLAKYLRNNNPDIVYSFMPDMNVSMAIAKILSFKKFKLVWGQFGTAPDFKAYNKIRERVYKLQLKLEFIADAILSDSNGGIEFYKHSGYKLKKSRVIYSGSDLERFVRNIKSRDAFRTAYKLKADDIAIGICSRLDPMKGYTVLAQAAKKILEKYSNVFFYSIGYGNNEIINNCKEILASNSSQFIWLGRKSDPENYMSGWDIYCSTSLYGEGFSNSIIEAMACSLPVVATNIGEANHQVGDTGYVLLPGDADELYAVLDEMIHKKTFIELGKKARERVEKNFSSNLMASSTQDFIKDLLSSK